MNPDNTVWRKRRGSSCPQAGLRGESTLSAQMTAAPPPAPEPGWTERVGGAPLTLGAEAEVGRGGTVLIGDGASVHATVNGGRLNDGQGRRPLVPGTAEKGDPPCEVHHCAQPGAGLRS